MKVASAAPLKILFVDNEVCDFLSHRRELARHARDMGFEVHVAAPEEPGADRIREMGYWFHKIPLQRKSANPLIEIRCFLALVRLYRSLRPTIIHQFRLKPALYGGIAARLLRLGGVVSLITGLGHLFVTDTRHARLLRSPVRWGFRFAFGGPTSAAIFQNPEDMEMFIGRDMIDRCKAHLIRGSGVDTSVFIPTPEPAGIPVVVLAGRMLWAKGIAEFVSAARLLRAKGVPVRFALVGRLDPGHPAAVSLARLEAWAAEGIVEWWGWREDMPALIAAATLFCLPSHREGLPRVLIEAAAGGRALIATDTPGCREIVRHGVNGLLVGVGDSEALAEAIRTLVENRGMRVAMALRSREMASSAFTLNQVIAETIAVYGSLTNKGTGARDRILSTEATIA